jgi:hypothetical protein
MLSQGLYKGKEGEAVRLYVEPEENAAASQKAGRPIFDEILYAEVTSPGQKESAPVFILERKYADEVGIAEPYRSPKFEQYRELVDAYRNGREGTDVRGTPLSAWPRMTVALVATAQAAGIYTVEALAALPDTRFAAFGPGARSLVEQAKAFCEAAAGNAPTEALAAENEQLRTDLADLRRQLADLSDLMTAQQAPQAAQTAPEPTKAVEPPAPPPEAPVAAPEAPKGGKAKSGGGNALPII